MAKVTVVFGVLLVLLGIVGYVSTGSQHPTALIPSGFGALLAVFGVLANSPVEKKRALWMHIAVTLGLLGFLGTAKSLVDFVKLQQGAYYPFPAAVESKAAMAVILLLFVLLCVRSFIVARRNRQA